MYYITEIEPWRALGVELRNLDELKTAMKPLLGCLLGGVNGDYVRIIESNVATKSLPIFLMRYQPLKTSLETPVVFKTVELLKELDLIYAQQYYCILCDLIFIPIENSSAIIPLSWYSDIPQSWITLNFGESTHFMFVHLQSKELSNFLILDIGIDIGIPAIYSAAKDSHINEIYNNATDAATHKTFEKALFWNAECSILRFNCRDERTLLEDLFLLYAKGFSENESAGAFEVQLCNVLDGCLPHYGLLEILR